MISRWVHVPAVSVCIIGMWWWTLVGDGAAPITDWRAALSWAGVGFWMWLASRRAVR